MHVWGWGAKADTNADLIQATAVAAIEGLQRELIEAGDELQRLALKMRDLEQGPEAGRVLEAARKAWRAAGVEDDR